MGQSHGMASTSSDTDTDPDAKLREVMAKAQAFVTDTNAVFIALEKARLQGDLATVEAMLHDAKQLHGLQESNCTQCSEAESFRRELKTLKLGLSEAIETHNRTRLDKLIAAAKHTVETMGMQVLVW
jgi:hypothetical protein